MGASLLGGHGGGRPNLHRSPPASPERAPDPFQGRRVHWTRSAHGQPQPARLGTHALHDIQDGPDFVASKLWPSFYTALCDTGTFVSFVCITRGRRLKTSTASACRCM